jgi:homoserine kinase type II
METVYLVMHERSDTGDLKTIGVYSSEAAAKAAVESVRNQPGFCDYPDGFTIDGYKLDLVCWAEGFVDV